MIIRPIEPSDNETLAKIIRATFDEHGAPKSGTVFSDPTTDNLYNLFREGGAVLWVAEKDGEIQGCCGIYPTEGLPKGCAELVKFYLAAGARGTGIGRALMERSIESAKEMGYSEIYLESLPAFSKAINIYKKQGFETLNKPLGNSGHSSCDIWMLKKI